MNFPEINLVSTDWFWITGRGSACTIEPKNNPDLHWTTMRNLTGTYLYVDGNEYRCTGVEKFAVAWDHPANQKGPWGILLKPQFECFDTWHTRIDISGSPPECFTCHQKREVIYDYQLK